MQPLKNKIAKAQRSATVLGKPYEECILEITRGNRWCTACRKWEPEKYFLQHNGNYASSCLKYRKGEEGQEVTQPSTNTVAKYNQLVDIKNTAFLFKSALLVKEKNRVKEIMRELWVKIEKFDAGEGRRC